MLNCQVVGGDFGCVDFIYFSIIIFKFLLLLRTRMHQGKMKDVRKLCH